MAEGLHFPSFETSSEDSAGETKSKEKSKKKKSPEATEAPPEKSKAEEVKKESIAEHSKSVWQKLLGEDKADEKAEKPTDGEITDEVPAEESEVVETTASEAESMEISPEENRVIDEQLKAANIERLQADIAATDDEAEIMADQAAIDMLEQMPTGELTSELLDEQPAETEVATDPGVFSHEDEPLPFEEDGDVPLTPQPANGGSRGTGGSGSPPPHSPRSGGGPAVPPGPGFSAFGAPERTSRPHDNDPHMISTADAVMHERRAAGRGLLVGGVVGYLIGRRRGRIKTEKRMNVIARKLEQQVEAKQQVIERQIEATKQRARQEYWATKGSKVTAERPLSAVSSTRRPERPAHFRSEAVPLPGEGAIERAESVRRERPERTRDVQAMSDEEVLKRSETIKVGATNLRQVFEAKLITKNGLRRLVAEAEHGGDVRRGLAREFLAKELSYERDPHFRDLPDDIVVRGSSSPVAAVHATGSSDEPAVRDSSPAAPSQARPQVKPTTRHFKSPQVSTGLLALLTVLALGLAAVAVLLSLLR